MTEDTENYDIGEVDFSDASEGSYEPLDGIYLVEVIGGKVKSDAVAGKKGVQLEYELLEERAGMKVREYFNLQHPNPGKDGRPSVAQIGKGQYKKRCMDMGFEAEQGRVSNCFGKKLYLRIKPEASNQINPNTGEPYINSAVKGSYALDKKPKVKGAPAIGGLKPISSESPQGKVVFDDDDIPF